MNQDYAMEFSFWIREDQKTTLCNSLEIALESGPMYLVFLGYHLLMLACYVDNTKV